jgi:hypothetical protein
VVLISNFESRFNINTAKLIKKRAKKSLKDLAGEDCYDILSALCYADIVFIWQKKLDMKYCVSGAI